MTDEKTRQYQKQLRNLRDHVELKKQQMLEQVQKPVDNATRNDISTSSLRSDTVGVSEGDKEIAIGLYDNIEQTQAEIVAALERIAEGTFGLCKSCGKKIAEERLKAIPYALRCVACSRTHAAVANG